LDSNHRRMRHYLRNTTNTLIDIGGFQLPPMFEEWFFDDVSFAVDDNVNGLISLFESSTTIQQQINSGDLLYKVDGVNKSTQKFYDFFQDFKEDFTSNKVELKKSFFKKSDSGKIAVVSEDDGIKLIKLDNYSVHFSEFVGSVSITGTSPQVYYSVFRPDLPDGEYIIEVSGLWNRDSSNSDTILGVNNYGTTILSKEPQIEGIDSGGSGVGGTNQAYDFFIKKKVVVNNGFGLALDFTFRGTSNSMTTIFFANFEIKRRL